MLHEIGNSGHRKLLKTKRPPSSSLSYGAVNDDVRSPGSGGTPGPLSQPPPQTLDATDPGEISHASSVLVTQSNLTVRNLCRPSTITARQALPFQQPA
ncbi:unnamed protein product [Leptidea sinapis]|uniref:Uncharacterized protein n=1 Tax=Leptidea sinapis TaxID=189913 RepID=A0A5E4R234_9NEOP|nr:unnamed protein product [Leptidea sinapis]